MKIKETLTTEQKIAILNGGTSGIFSYLILPSDVFYNERSTICLGYYFNNSAEKTISPSYKKIIKFVSENENVTPSADELIARIIRSKYLEKWTRIYNALADTTYNPLYEYEKSEHREAENSDKITYNTNISDYGTSTENSRENGSETVTLSEQDVTVYNTREETNGETGTREHRSRTADSQDSIFGFNSSNAVGSNSSSEIEDETITRIDSENTERSVTAKTGTDTLRKTTDETDASLKTNDISKQNSDLTTKTGNDTTDKIVDEDVTAHGRNTAGSEMLLKEIDFRSAQIFYDIIYKDIDSITTLQIYI